MKKSRFERAVVVIFCAIALIAIHQLLASHVQKSNPPAAPHGAGDWPTWLSAIGTIGTFIYAIVLANTQERQRRKDARTVAQVYAAGLESEMNQAIDLLSANKMEISSRINNNSGAFRPKEITGRFKEIKQIDAQDIAILVPLHDGLAVKLADAQGRLNVIRKRYEGALVSQTPDRAHPEHPNIHHLQECNSQLLDHYFKLRDHCKRVANELRDKVTEG